MPRIDPLTPPFPEPTAQILATMMPAGMEPLLLFRTLAKNPRILTKIRGENLLDRGTIERVDRELIILRTCANCGSEYEWGVHVALFARRFGISEEKIAGTRQWIADDVRWSPHESLVLGFVDALHAESKLSDGLWVALRAEFEEEQLIEMIVLTGFYHTISFVTNALEIELEAGAERFPASG